MHLIIPLATTEQPAVPSARPAPAYTSLLLHVGVAEHVSRYSPPSPNLTRHDAL